MIILTKKTSSLMMQKLMSCLKRKKLKCMNSIILFFAIVKKVEDMIKEIDYLENQPWAKN